MSYLLKTALEINHFGKIQYKSDPTDGLTNGPS